MSRQPQGPKVETRLGSHDYERFNKLAQTKGLTTAQLARDAICHFLDQLDREDVNARESLLETRIRKMENRLAALLVRGNIDTGIIVSLLYSRMNKETRNADIQHARSWAIKNVRKKVLESDDLLANIVTDSAPEAGQ